MVSESNVYGVSDVTRSAEAVSRAPARAIT
jgi:hypothetical protein